MRSSILHPSWLSVHRGSLLMFVAVATCVAYVAWLVQGPQVRTIPVSIPMAVPLPVVAPLALAPEPLPAEAPVPVALIQETVSLPLADRLPAISADGATIAVRFMPGDEVPMKVRFVAVTTSEVVDELELTERNTRDVHDRLDAGRYRTLQSLPRVDVGSERVPGLSMLMDEEQDSPDVSVIDEDNNRVLWTDRFLATERGYPARPDREDAGPDCYPSRTSSIATWWDWQTQTILAEVRYVGWACDCPTWAVHHYARTADATSHEG
ncbi:MAG: hypothetical protein ACKV2T_10775 [Kofleriaceae bacterium]